MIRDLVALAKPRLSSLVIFSTGIGIYLAPGTIETWRLVLAILGTVLMVAGANTLNMYLERDVDALMARTKDRPLPAARLSPDVALWMGVLLAIVSVFILVHWVNMTSGALALLAFFVYVFVYTPLKKKSNLALQVGGISGALPPMIGWTAVTGSIDPPALVLFGIVFLWQVPHFLAISIVHQNDYAQAGIRIFPLERGEPEARLAVVHYTLALMMVSLLLVPLRVAGLPYLAMALLLGGAFLWVGVQGLKAQDVRAWARRLFFMSLVYLTALFAGLVVDRMLVR